VFRASKGSTLPISLVVVVVVEAVPMPGSRQGSEYMKSFEG
jgi:hypothetical protein